MLTIFIEEKVEFPLSVQSANWNYVSIVISGNGCIFSGSADFKISTANGVVKDCMDDDAASLVSGLVGCDFYVTRPSAASAIEFLVSFSGGISISFYGDGEIYIGPER